MSMRWILTWRPSDEHPKRQESEGQIVVLGYQHPEVAVLKVASPTLSRLGKIAELECADAKCAFLQSDGEETQETEDVCARALEEIVCAMNVSMGCEIVESCVRTWKCTTELVAVS